LLNQVKRYPLQKGRIQEIFCILLCSSILSKFLGGGGCSSQNPPLPPFGRGGYWEGEDIGGGEKKEKEEIPTLILPLFEGEDIPFKPSPSPLGAPLWEGED